MKITNLTIRTTTTHTTKDFDPPISVNPGDRVFFNPKNMTIKILPPERPKSFIRRVISACIRKLVPAQYP